GIWGVFGSPNVETIYFVAFGPVIPRRVALQQSPLLFHRTKRVWFLGDSGQFENDGSPNPWRQTKRAISQIPKAIFRAIDLGEGFHGICISCWHIQTQSAFDSPTHCAAAGDCKKFPDNQTGRGEARWRRQIAVDKSAPI